MIEGCCFSPPNKERVGFIYVLGSEKLLIFKGTFCATSLKGALTLSALRNCCSPCFSLASCEEISKTAYGSYWF